MLILDTKLQNTEELKRIDKGQERQKIGINDWFKKLLEDQKAILNGQKNIAEIFERISICRDF